MLRTKRSAGWSCVVDGLTMTAFSGISMLWRKLYQRIRAYNVAFYKQRDRTMYEQTLAHLIEETKKGRMFGEWNDYGRL